MKISVAYIKKPRGLKGELAVVPYKIDTESLRPGIKVTLKKESLSQDFVIESVLVLKDRIGLKLRGIDTEEAATSWRSGEVLVEMENLASLPKGEYYHFQLEGSEVFEENGKYLGIISGIEYMSANDVLTVKSEDGEILLPFIKNVIKSVDVAAKKIIVRKIEGLY